MSSLIYKLIGEHDLSDAIEKRHCWAADTSDDGDCMIITGCPFAAVAELFTFIKRPLMADSSPSIYSIISDLNVRFGEKQTLGADRIRHCFSDQIPTQVWVFFFGVDTRSTRPRLCLCRSFNRAIISIIPLVTALRLPARQPVMVLLPSNAIT